jgi:hypothetical protein
MISWIYLHGHELDRKIENRWVKYWLCKHCFDSGTMKTLASESTTSCQQHLKNAHSIHPPGVIAPTPIESYFEEVYPLAAERWRVDFMNWITHDNISFAQAASERLHKVISGGGPHVKHLLPCERTVRSWVIPTYQERIIDVKKSLAGARSKINISFDA